MAKHASDWKQDSFFMIYASDAKELYKQKILSAEAYVLMIIKIHSKAGWKWTFDPKEFCAEWEISRSTFYRAVSRLKNKGLIHWEVEGRLTVWHGSDIASEPVPDVRFPVQHVGLEIPDVRLPVQHVGSLQPETVTQSESRNAPDSFQINLKSSSDLIREEELKIQEKKAEEIECKQSLALSALEEEVNQGGELECQSAALPDPEEESVPRRAPGLNPDEVSLNETSHSYVASLMEKPKLRDAAIDPEKDNQPAPESLHSDLEIDQDFLLWVMEVKLPTMKLNTQPVNVEAYARGMLRRDGEKLQAEYADVVAEQNFIKKAAELTAQVEVRVREWQKVSHAKLTTFHDLDGMPCVLLDGITIGAVDFLAKAVEAAPMVATIPFSPENREARPARMSRLKMSSKINENPGFEFLEQCWGDFFLRPQVSLILAKHPDWAVVREGKLLAIA